MRNIDKLKNIITELEERRNELIKTVSEEVNSKDNIKKFLKSVGKNIVHYRQKQKMTQEDLAEMTGLSRTSITNAESGRQNLPAARLFMIANALQIPAFKLLKNTFDPLSEVEHG